MSNNLIICGIIVLLIAALMQTSDNQDNLTTLLYVVLICGIIYTLNKNGNLVNNTGTVNESFEDAVEDAVEDAAEDAVDNVEDAVEDAAEEVAEKVQEVAGNASAENQVQPSGNAESELDAQFQVDDSLQSMPEERSAHISAEGLLPQSGNAWPNQPTIQSSTSDESFLDAQSIIGMSSNVLRNASYDLRCAPSNPRVDVGPWQQTTMEPDLTRRPLEGPECGSCNSGNSNEQVLAN